MRHGCPCYDRSDGDPPERTPHVEAVRRRDPENDEERQPCGAALFVQMNPGDVLLSQGITPQVPSALRGLTSVFGMGTGVTLSPWSPETCCQWVWTQRTPEQARAIVYESKPSAD